MLLRLRPAAYGLICATFWHVGFTPDSKTYRCDAAKRRLGPIQTSAMLPEAESCYCCAMSGRSV